MKQPKTIQFPGELIILGMGTSVGVPAIGCSCAVCASTDPRNKRTRSGAILGLPQGNLLIDTSPDLRQQLVREGIGMVHAVVYTHEHADHIFGMDDLRLFQFYLGYPVPIFCEEHVEQRLKHSFDYAFQDIEQTHVGAVPKLQFHTIEREPFEVLGTEVIPLPLKHGPRFDVLGFRFGNVAYCTDCNFIPPETEEKMQGLDTLVLNALRHTPHPTHFTIEESVEVAKRLGAKQTYFVHCSCELDYEKENANLPANMKLAYDGLRIRLT